MCVADDRSTVIRPFGAQFFDAVRVGPIPLVEEIDGRPVRATPPSVMARLTVQPRQRVYELADVPVHFLTPVGFNLRPGLLGDGRAGKISIRVSGPAKEEPAVYGAAGGIGGGVPSRASGRKGAGGALAGRSLEQAERARTTSPEPVATTIFMASPRLVP